MQKMSLWYKGLTRIGQLSVISAVGLGSLFAVSAISPPPSNPVTELKEEVHAPAEVQKEPQISTKKETKTAAIPYEKRTIESDSMPEGNSIIQTKGVNGQKTITDTITLTDGVETGRVSNVKTTVAPIDEIKIVGTYVKPVPNCDSNYSGCVPVVSYDLDCADIGYSVAVYGYDKHGFDRDGDGSGCESF